MCIISASEVTVGCCRNEGIWKMSFERCFTQYEILSSFLLTGYTLLEICELCQNPREKFEPQPGFELRNF